MTKNTSIKKRQELSLANQKQNVEALLQHPYLWRASQAPPTSEQPANSNSVIKSGFSQVDKLLCNNGWPLGNLIECLAPLSSSHHFKYSSVQHNSLSQNNNIMQGALHLFLPAIRQLASKKRPIILVAPPYVPYLPGWHINTDSTQASPLWVVSPDTTTHLLWACEQILQSNSASTVLIWLNPLKKQQHGESQKKNHYHLRSVHLRKLQLAARRSQSLVVALRDINNQQKSSPAPLRICLEPTAYKQKTRLQVHFLKQPGSWGGQKTTIAWHNRLQTAAIAANQWPVYNPTQDLLNNYRQEKNDNLAQSTTSTAKWS